MIAPESEIETPKGRVRALKNLVSELFYDQAEFMLNRPSRTNGTGKLTCLEFAKLGKEEFRTIEHNILFSNANLPLAAVLRTAKRYKSDLDDDYLGYMIKYHGGKFNSTLNSYDLENPDERVECLRALYKAHGFAHGIDYESDFMTFDHSTAPHDFITRSFSNSAHIHIPSEAAHYSYIGLMNAICDLFLKVEKQNPDVIAKWNNKPDPENPGSNNYNYAA